MRLRLNGRDANERIEMSLLEVLGDSEDECCITCTLGIDIGNCSVRRERIISDMGALRRFKDQLQLCYDLLEGKATYSMPWEDELQFSVSMTRNGHAVVSGAYRERSELTNELLFEMETDQSCFPPVLRAIGQFEDACRERPTTA